FRYAVLTRLGVLEYAAGASRVERLRPLPEGQRFTRRRPQHRRGASRHVKIRRQQDLAGCLQAAAIVAERHGGRGHVRYAAVSPHELDGPNELADQATTKVRVAEDRTADGAGRAGPRFEPGETVIDRPPHETVDRHGSIGPDGVRVDGV